MRIKSVAVAACCCISDTEIVCNTLTALVGADGARKSIFSFAIELFYSTSPRLAEEDSYDENTLSPTEIAVTFANLDENEKERRHAH